MEKYTMAYRLVRIKEGAQTQIDIDHHEFRTFEDAHDYLGKIDPDEVVNYTILPIYKFKKNQY